MSEKERNETGVAPKEDELEEEERLPEPEPEESDADSFPASDPPSY